MPTFTESAKTTMGLYVVDIVLEDGLSAVKRLDGKTCHFPIADHGRRCFETYDARFTVELPKGLITVEVGARREGEAVQATPRCLDRLTELYPVIEDALERASLRIEIVHKSIY